MTLRGDRDTWADHCPTCGQDWAPTDEDCAVIKPGTEHDVIPVQCRLSRLGHPVGYHWHPSLWTGTPDLIWEEDGPPLTVICGRCHHVRPTTVAECPRCE